MWILEKLGFYVIALVEFEYETLKLLVCTRTDGFNCEFRVFVT